MARKPYVDLIAGARPNFMKIAPIIWALRKARWPFKARIVHTGQHYDRQMSGVFFEELDLPEPDVHLEVGSGPHGAQTARVIERYEKVLLKSDPKPRFTVVVGDVNSTLGCALAAVKLGIPVAHVEAGLRSFDRTMPEEINRIVTDQISSLHFVSEPSGVKNLKREGIAPSGIHHVGNVMIDCLIRFLPRARRLGMASRLGLRRGSYAFATIHRPANVDSPEAAADWVRGFEEIGNKLDVVLPLHPRTKSRLGQFGLLSKLDRSGKILVLEALGYLPSVSLLEAARVVVTDSGGLQEEATYLNIPCFTLRPNTERPVTLTGGANTLLGQPGSQHIDYHQIVSNGTPRKTQIPLWDGRASARILRILTSFLEIS